VAGRPASILRGRHESKSRRIPREPAFEAHPHYGEFALQPSLAIRLMD
jgi:hypothetical protein